MLHKITATPDFRDERPDSPIAEIGMRVLIERANWQFEVIGTATLICGYLAITARHVVEHALRKYGATSDGKKIEIDSFEIKLIQLVPGPKYRIWRVHRAWPCDTDIVLLHLALDRTSDLDESIEWKSARLRMLPPSVGQHIVAYGYRQGEVSVTESDGTHQIELNDKPTTSVGKVRQIYPTGRDRVMLPFPCFEVEARFEAGMSGGLVVDEAGAVCGLICASLHSGDCDAPPISYVVSLWPMLKTVINADRGDKYPRGVSYPVIDLAIGGQISVADLEQLSRGQLIGDV